MNASRMEILRLRLQSLYEALYKLPTTVPVAELAGLMQHQANLNSQIAELEKQIEAGGAAAPLAGSTASTLNTIPEARIEIVEQEHQSGLYGNVFKGRQTDLQRIVAVKIIKPVWPSAANAIEHAKAIARAGAHPNIVTVYCVERVRVPNFDESQPAMIMEWLDGKKLADRLAGPQFSEEEVRQICIGVLAGVQHMHANGIAHGDLHPGNVIVVSDGTPKIIDIAPDKDISLTRLSTISRDGATQSDIEYCQNIIFRVFSHGPFLIAARNRMDGDLRQAQSIEDLRAVVDRGLAMQSEVENGQKQLPQGTRVSDQEDAHRDLKRQRDMATIKDLFSVLPRPLVDKVLDEAMSDRILTEHIDCLIGAEAIFRSTLFHLYDINLRQLLEDVFNHWNAAWDVGRATHHDHLGRGIATLTVGETGPSELWDEHERYLDHVMQAQRAMAGLTKHLHEMFPDFDLVESDKEASRKYWEMVESVKRRAEELWGKPKPDLADVAHPEAIENLSQSDQPPLGGTQGEKMSDEQGEVSSSQRDPNG